MKFNQAHAKLQKIAAGRYNSLKYAVTTYGEGEKKEQACQLYINPSISVEAPSWQEAFKLLDQKLNPKKPRVVLDDVEEI